MRRRDPFIIKEEGGDIKDRHLSFPSLSVDGDIVVADSYRKHPRHQWAKFRSNSALFYACVFLFTLLAGKLYYLQIVRGAEYYGAAEQNRIRAVPIVATRGVVFDRNGKRLAYNVPDFGLYVVPGDLPANQEEEDIVFAEIAKIVGRDQFDLIESFAKWPRSSFLNVEILRGLSQEQAVQLSRKAQDWRGVKVMPIETRAYTAAEPLAHILGYTGKISELEYKELRSQGYDLTEYVGKTGVEKFYEPSLRGLSGAALIEVDSLGKEKQMVDQKAPVPGYNIYLNIDWELQSLAWRELEAMVKKLHAPGGAVIVMNPATGAILSLVNYPSFDNALFAKGISSDQYQALLNDPAKPLYNRAISGEYPSGSTFKLIVGSAALEEGLINEHFTVLSQGGININGYFFPDWKAGGHGLTDITKALAESVNTFFYTIGGGNGNFAGLGVEKIVFYGEQFGLTKPTGIDLPSEAAGFLPSKEWKLKTRGERWFLGDTYHLAIGQGDILVTPLQVANFTAVIANGGTLYKPQMVDHMVLSDGTSHIVKPEIIRAHVVSDETIATIAAGMRQAVTAGSAQSLSTVDAPLAGKTGTAEYGESGPPHAWFTGFGPYPDAEIVVTVLVEAGEGGNIASTPIAKKIFEYYFNKTK
ncbi:MAG: penicillin-binding protein 2 [Candidatus Komeilibacteria bacterium]|nr:penicillin-binding protein 2 [Candidatus Komeilibacteria bacterium]